MNTEKIYRSARNNLATQLVRQNILELAPYESARSLDLDSGLLENQSTISLDANEAPVDLWSEEGGRLNRYPEPQPRILLNRFSKLYGTSPRSILIGRGSDEAIDLLIRGFCEPKEDEILICPPTYGMYEVSARIQGVTVQTVPLLQNTEGFSLDETAIHRKLNQNRNIKIAFLCVPNNPTGTGFAPEALIRIAEMTSDKCLLVIDEAYQEFSKFPSMSDWLSRFPHLVVLRTLSKAWALAGVRCGTALAQPEVIEILQKIRAPYPIPTPCVDVIVAATSDAQQGKMRRQVESILEQRDQLSTQLARIPWIENVFPSDTNFILFKLDEAQTASKTVYEALRKQGIILRDRSKDLGLKNCIRITIGTPAENQKVLEALVALEERSGRLRKVV